MAIKDRLKALVAKAKKQAEPTTESMERMKKTVEAIRKAAKETRT